MRLTRRQLLSRTLGHTLGWGAGLGLSGSGLGLVQAYAPAQLNRLRAVLPGLNAPLTVALLADLHYGPYIGERQISGWVDLALSARPDLTLVLGDFCDVALSEGPPTPLLRQLARLHAPLGVYGVWGNHDYGSFGKFRQPFSGPARADWAEVQARFEAALRAGGLSILTNRGLSVRPDLWLGGIDDWSQSQADPQKALQYAPDSTAQLLMCHEPDTIMTLAAAPAWRPGGLAVAGHTHGGQIRLPVLGALTVPSAYGERFAQGWVEGAPQGGRPAARGYVSRGLGLSGIPIRNLCPPEVVLLELRGS
ncbi:metallophosphoesterase [Deinococcus sp.]|uniref:metallophosphoesterase n=1 Tax=Deinococcus sp. TaxID=47478 RepID=UPI003C7A6A50